MQTVSIDRDEINQFALLAADWWDADGPMALLHEINPLRLKYCRDNLKRHFALETPEFKPLADLEILDVGCGGGLLSEPLANMGATMTAIDASKELIAVATAHSNRQSLDIDYKVATVEELAVEGALFDAVISMEVIEHVKDFRNFMAALVSLVRPGGALIMATINRTPKSYIHAIIGAEYVLRWLPKGTHHWRRFRKPAELGRCLRAAGMELCDITGMNYRPRMGEWRLTRKTDVNYLAYATRP